MQRTRGFSLKLWNYYLLWNLESKINSTIISREFFDYVDMMPICSQKTEYLLEISFYSPLSGCKYLSSIF